VKVCPEPQVLDFKKAGEYGLIKSGDCSNCGRCITVCPEDTLHFNFQFNKTKRVDIEDPQILNLNKNYR
jgi:ferredoxin-type protein NapH